MFKRICAILIAGAMVLAATGCGTSPIREAATPKAASESVPELAPEPVSTPAPTPEPTPVPTERPILKGTEELLSALENLGIEIDPNKTYTTEELIAFMVNLLGVDEEALKADYQHPFQDVSPEYSPYVGYAYARWLLSGIPGNTLGAKDAAPGSLLVSMLLRAMDYSDRGDAADFSSGDAYALAESLGIAAASLENGLRGDDLASLLWASLSAPTKEGDTFAEELIDQRIFSSSDFEEAEYLSRGETPPPKPTRKPVDRSEEVLEPIPATAESGSGGGSSGGGSSGGSSGGGSSGGGGTGGDSGGAGSGGGAGGDSETPAVSF